MRWVLFFSMVWFTLHLKGQSSYDRQDSLRGAITPERVWWDVSYYHLAIEVKPDTREIMGSNRVYYQVLESHDVLQIDLQAPLKITKVLQEGQSLDIRSEGNAHFITLTKPQQVGNMESIQIFYAGKPQTAKRPPWDGGVTWQQDAKGMDFIATSCQGLGASVWWPNKDHMYDEVDSMLMSIEVPQALVDVSNGRLRNIEQNDQKGTKTYHWFVANPINNYGVNINIGDYVSWSAPYSGLNGPLDVTYWVLRENEAKAKKHFVEAPRMLEAFEFWLGPYPFYEDGFQLVEAPYLGMEHQSSITYGNQFQNGYLGRDVSGTGWGLKFDFIIVHESGHEWFANNVTFKDAADIWIHEGFTAYSESLFVEYFYGKAAGQEYCRGTRKGIRNKFPMIGDYHVNSSHHDNDVYSKGANILNTVRQILNDDERWRQTLRGIGTTFYHQTVTTEQIETYMAEKTGLELQSFFNQYLRTFQIPIFEYHTEEGKLIYRWGETLEGFNMPIDLKIDDEAVRLMPTTSWQAYPLAQRTAPALEIDPNYYIEVKPFK